MKQITWLLWRALHTSPTDIGQQLQTMRELHPDEGLSVDRRRFQLISSGLSIILSVFLIGWLITGQHWAVVISSGLVIVLGSILLLILASGTLHGVRWAFQIATIVYQDIHHGRYDLMSLSPLGVLGSLWTMTHRQTRINRVIAFFQTVSLALFLAMLLVGIVFIATLLQGPPTIFLSQPILASVLGVGWVIGVFYLDYVQAVVIGHLSGIYLASMDTSLMTVQVLAMGVSIAIQMGAYLIAGLVAILGAIVATMVFPNTMDASILLILLAFIITLYGFREVAIRVLWRTILTKFDVTNVEFAEFQQAVT